VISQVLPEDLEVPKILVVRKFFEVPELALEVQLLPGADLDRGSPRSRIVP
jgi:hypothetical protein